MNYKLLFSIAKSLMLARWRQTLIAAIGVTFSITMFISLLGFMTGLNDLLDGLITNRTAHIRLFNEENPNENQPINSTLGFTNKYNFINSIKTNNTRQSIYNYHAIYNTLLKDNRLLGIAPRVTAQVIINQGTIDITGIINGIDVNSEIKLFNFKEYIISGNPSNLNVIPNSIILGKGVAEKLIANIGDVIQITSVNGERFPLKVIGIFATGMRDIDKTICYTNLSTSQKILSKENNYITELQIKLKDINLAPMISKEYAHLFNVRAEDIQTVNAQFETGSFIRTLISYSVGITLLIVAGFGIYNILNMMIFEKMDAIAILKAIGFSGSDVKHIFIFISLTIGIFGGILGLIFGFALSYLIDQVPFTTMALPSIKTYPINYSIFFYLIGLIFSLITTYLAGLFPARKASKIDPVIIIRGK